MSAIAMTLPLAAPGREHRPLMARLLQRPRREDPEADLVRRLRAGEEAAFEQLVSEYGPAMLRVARIYVRDRAVAEEVVQETWLAVLNGIGSFEGRSTLKTWIFRILANRAKTRAEREGRTRPLSSLADAGAEAGEPTVDPDRFFGPDHPRSAYQWAAPPRAWPQDRVLERETLELIQRTIESLPDLQREVIRLRDVEGWEAKEVAEALQISDANQRVLLHRARSRVRAALEDYLDPEAAP
jgi:RNA polymerase sigma-70 factor (ECF subfamily)